MEETIDYEAVIAQLQAENEALRLNAKIYNEIQNALWSPIVDLQAIWQKCMAHKSQLLIALMLIYWTLSILFMIWEKLR